MYKLDSIFNNLQVRFKSIKRDKRYKKLKSKFLSYRDNIVKVIYIYYDNLCDIKLKVTKLYKSFVRYLLRRFRFYDNALSKLLNDFVNFFVKKDNPQSKSVLDIINGYVIFILCYGFLINIGLGVFDVELSLRNISISGVIFYFIKEELFGMLLLLVRGVKL